MGNSGGQPLSPKNLGELGLYRLQEHQVLDHIHAELVADALAPTHVLELLLEAPPPARDAAEGEARLVGERGNDQCRAASSP